jgi:hypothetical protein
MTTLYVFMTKLNALRLMTIHGKGFSGFMHYGHVFVMPAHWVTRAATGVECIASRSAEPPAMSLGDLLPWDRNRWHVVRRASDGTYVREELLTPCSCRWVGMDDAEWQEVIWK